MRLAPVVVARNLNVVAVKTETIGRTEVRLCNQRLRTYSILLVGRGFSPPMPRIDSKGGLKPRPTVFICPV